MPGAGKTTLTKILIDDKYPTLSVDDNFTNSQTGDYQFDFSKNHLAYKVCEQAVENIMQNNTSKNFLHNVFSMLWELEPYFKLAQKFDYTLHIMTFENYHGNKNVHHISDAQLQKMEKKLK